MSRIGKLPVNLPSGVAITVGDDHVVKVKGPLGELSQKIDPDIEVSVDGGVLTVKRPTDQPRHRSMHGLYRALIANMVTGVTHGFKRTLQMVGTGYRAEAKGSTLTINIGFSHPVIMEAPENIAFATPNPTTIEVSGINKQQVGNIAADIRAIRPPEPYLGKGIKYDDEVIRRKEGKTGKK